MITRENYEEYMMMYMDGELQPAEEAALKDFLDLHPDLKNELLTYKLAKLSPDTSIVFAGKSSLLKTVPAKRTISFPQWRKYGIAAGIAAIFFISLYKFSAQDRDSKLVKTGKSILQNRGTKQTQPNSDTVQSPVTATAKNDTVTPAPVIYKTSKTVIAKSSIKNNRKNILAPGEAITSLPAITPVTVNKVALAAIKELPYHKPETVKLPETAIPVYAFTADHSEERKTLWDKLPIDELKKKELNNISAGITNTYGKMIAVKNNPDEKKPTIKVEKRGLLLSF